jgi:hypothetical protein
VTAVAGPVERHDLHDRYDLHHGVWPLTARVTAHRGIAVGGVALTELAGRYGTPAYVLDEADVRERCRRYRQVSPDAEIAYAGKAFLCRAMAHWVDEEGLSLDVCSEGELAVARSAGRACCLDAAPCAAALRLAHPGPRGRQGTRGRSRRRAVTASARTIRTSKYRLGC